MENNKDMQTSELYEQEGWISVKEKLPTKEDSSKNYEQVLAILNNKEKTKRYWHWETVANNSSCFIFWKPLS